MALVPASQINIGDIIQAPRGSAIVCSIETDRGKSSFRVRYDVKNDYGMVNFGKTEKLERHLPADAVALLRSEAAQPPRHSSHNGRLLRENPNID